MPKYEKKITLGRDKDGKLIRRSVYAGTKPELEQKVFRARQDFIAASEARPEGDVTLVAFARRWLDTEKRHAAVNTRAMYENVIEKHLAPALDELYFSEITLDDLQRILDRNFSKYETCNKIRLTLRQLYASAADHGIPAHRSVSISKLALPKKEKHEKRALTDQEKEALEKAELDGRQKLFVGFLYYCGLRREEALALDHGSVDLKNRQVTVSHALVFDKNAPRIERTKNAYSNRVVPIPSKFAQVLRGHGHDETGLLFCMADGSPMTKSSFTKFWQGIQKKLSEHAPTAGTLTPHIFRHNYATQLYYSEVSLKKAAQLMGHADTSMITKVYAHLDDQKERAEEKLDRIFS